MKNKIWLFEDWKLEYLVL